MCQKSQSVQLHATGHVARDKHPQQYHGRPSSAPLRDGESSSRRVSAYAGTVLLVKDLAELAYLRARGFARTLPRWHYRLAGCRQTRSSIHDMIFAFCKMEAVRLIIRVVTFNIYILHVFLSVIATASEYVL